MMNTAIAYKRPENTFKPMRPDTTYVPDSANVKRGDVFLCDLSPVIGSEQGGVRAVCVIQNSIGNKFSPTIIVAAISSVRKKMPTHVRLDETDGVQRESFILLEQLRTIDRNRLDRKICTLNEDKMKEVNNALKLSLELN